MVVSSFLGLLINLLREEGRRRDSRSGCPLRSLQEGAEVGRKMKVYKKYNNKQSFLRAVLAPACTSCPGQQPALLACRVLQASRFGSASAGEEVSAQPLPSLEDISACLCL